MYEYVTSCPFIQKKKIRAPTAMLQKKKHIHIYAIIYVICYIVNAKIKFCMSGGTECRKFSCYVCLANKRHQT